VQTLHYATGMIQPLENTDASTSSNNGTIHQHIRAAEGVLVHVTDEYFEGSAQHLGDLAHPKVLAFVQLLTKKMIFLFSITSFRGHQASH
jgi:hypothetical protein